MADDSELSTSPAEAAQAAREVTLLDIIREQCRSLALLYLALALVIATLVVGLLQPVVQPIDSVVAHPTGDLSLGIGTVILCVVAGLSFVFMVVRIIRVLRLPKTDRPLALARAMLWRPLLLATCCTALIVWHTSELEVALTRAIARLHASEGTALGKVLAYLDKQRASSEAVFAAASLIMALLIGALLIGEAMLVLRNARGAH